MVKTLPHFVEDQTEVVLFGGGEGLAPLRLANLAPGVALPFHIFTAADGIPGEFVLTWRRGLPLPPEAPDMVWGYFAVAEAGEVLAFLLSQVKETEAGGGSPEPPKLQADTLLVWTQHFFVHEAARTPEMLTVAKSLLSTLAQGFVLSGNMPASVAGLRRHDSGLFSHCLNVSLLALAFSLNLGWKKHQGETLALGTLLHDLGMVPWAQDLFRQTLPLSDSEWEEIKTHPQRGAELLQSLDLPEEILVMIRQHHENLEVLESLNGIVDV